MAQKNFQEEEKRKNGANEGEKSLECNGLLGTPIKYCGREPSPSDDVGILLLITSA